MSVNVKRRPSLMLNVKIAYPGRLGPNIPPPPDGYVPYGNGFHAINRALGTVSWDGNAWVAP